MSAIPPLRDSDVTARAILLAPVDSGLDRGVDRLDPRRETINRWSAALARGDDDEVDRLVRQSRIDRQWAAAFGELGTMLGQSRPKVSSEVAHQIG